jgi:hypothetical protein
VLCTGLAGVIRCLYEALEGVTKTPLCLSVFLAAFTVFPTANSQRPTSPPTATHCQPSPNTRHPHRAAHRHATVSASRKGLPSCPCLEIAFAPQTLGFVTLYPSQFLSPSRLRAVFCHQPPTASVARLLLSPRQFPGRLVPPRSISYSAPRLHFLPSTILSCDKVQLCDFGICTPPQSGRLRCDSASCLFPPRLRRNTS